MILRIASVLLGVLTLLPAVSADTTVNGVRYVTYQAPDGTTTYLEDNRKPALYSQNFGDCLGNSLINVTRFDAAYYQDNMTVLFHLAGNSALQNESVMMYIGVFAYGENRFDLTFNPCGANIYSMCPINTSVPITANGIIPVSVNDVSNIPPIALSIPDFEGQAILRIFANSTQSEIGCYSAVITNGNTFAQPAAVGTVLGLFALTAIVASIATAAYGEVVPTMRLHYAHSMSVGVVFAVFQHIFFTGALSMNWPSVLVAWWTNFAWASGMIYTDSMQASINKLIGNNVGSTSAVGAAPAGSTQPNLGGGYDIHQIYGRSLSNHPLSRDIASEIYRGTVGRRSVAQKLIERSIARRDELANSSTGYKWYGEPVGVGLPLPGNYSGFAGTLAEEGLQISNAFLTGFLWLLILLLILIGSLAIVKGVLELFNRRKWMPERRMAFFRKHWLLYTGALVLRTCFIAWFMIMFLIIFQFTFQSPASVKAIAAIVFTIFIIGLPLIAGYACIYKATRDPSPVEQKSILNKVPFLRKKQITTEIELQNQPRSKSISKPLWKRVSSLMDNTDTRYSIHDDEDYIMKFGWLVSRFRRTKWWFFTYWLLYEFIRACFYAGASGHPLTQVFGLLVVEIFAFAFMLWAKPFEGRRLNVLVVYCLGFSKVTSVALSAAFDVQFNLPRITTTAIGIVIIVIQGILTVITCVAIVVGAISSYMSVMRNVEDFRPRKWDNMKEKYFDHLDRVGNDLPPPPKPAPRPKVKPQEEPNEPNFEMKNIRRLAKIEDEDPDEITDGRSSLQQPFPPFVESRPGSQARPASRPRTASAGSMTLGHGNLPYGARRHKASWSTRDFDSWNESNTVQTPIDMTRTLPEDVPTSSASPTVPKPTHARASSRGSTGSKPKKIRRQSSAENLRVFSDETKPTKPRPGSYAEDLRVFPDEVKHYPIPTTQTIPTQQVTNELSDRKQSKLPMLTPAQESEEFTSYFDHIKRQQQQR